MKTGLQILEYLTVGSWELYKPASTQHPKCGGAYRITAMNAAWTGTGTGGRAELCRLENSRRALVNDFNEKFTV